MLRKCVKIFIKTICFRNNLPTRIREKIDFLCKSLGNCRVPRQTLKAAGNMSVAKINCVFNCLNKISRSNNARYVAVCATH